MVGVVIGIEVEGEVGDGAYYEVVCLYEFGVDCETC